MFAHPSLPLLVATFVIHYAILFFFLFYFVLKIKAFLFCFSPISERISRFWLTFALQTNELND